MMHLLNKEALLTIPLIVEQLLLLIVIVCISSRVVCRISPFFTRKIFDEWFQNLLIERFH